MFLDRLLTNSPTQAACKGPEVKCEPKYVTVGRRRGRRRGKGWAAFGGIFCRQEGVGLGRWGSSGASEALGDLNKGALKTILYVTHKGAGSQGAPTLGTEEESRCWGHREMEGAPIPQP